ncbi:MULTISPECIES: sugar ABC transporter substrate-binding protein [unclassified Paraburkholderia]|uniref:sugar ABC transporter substrate-binding protein n=1 Tax=unclassified Paraburkholderia TaxID=2615204 RepID=UPI002AB1695D|nr:MULTISPECIES: sugar ABC transporter substrate-binding protein [unclassified Paraburkholderia]
MKAWTRVAVVAMGLMIVAGSASAADKKFVVGYTNLADTDVFTMSRKTAFGNVVKSDPDLSVIYTDANGDVSRQLDQIDNFIAQKVNAIVIVPVDYQGIVPGVERANKAGIPVIALGIQSAGGKYTFVGSKNFDAGRLQGEFMTAKLPKNAQVLYLQGTPGLYHSKERLAGFTQTLAKRSDVKILSNLPADYDRAEGMKVTEDWVERYPKFDAVVAANDQMALGALEALKTAGRLKGVMISGVDGTGDALHAIQAGDMSQTIFQNAKGQAVAAYQVVETLKSGKPAPAEVIVPFESVTHDNVGMYLK